MMNHLWNGCSEAAGFARRKQLQENKLSSLLPPFSPVATLPAWFIHMAQLQNMNMALVSSFLLLCVLFCLFPPLLSLPLHASASVYSSPSLIGTVSVGAHIPLSLCLHAHTGSVHWLAVSPSIHWLQVCALFPFFQLCECVCGTGGQCWHIGS